MLLLASVYALLEALRFLVRTAVRVTVFGALLEDEADDEDDDDDDDAAAPQGIGNIQVSVAAGLKRLGESFRQKSSPGRSSFSKKTKPAAVHAAGTDEPQGL